MSLETVTFNKFSEFFFYGLQYKLNHLNLIE